MVKDVKKPRILSQQDLERVLVLYRLRLDYEGAAQALRQGHHVFFDGIKRQTASYAAKKLSRMLGEQVVAIPSIYEGEKGYLFMKERELAASENTP